MSTTLSLWILVVFAAIVAVEGVITQRLVKRILDELLQRQPLPWPAFEGLLESAAAGDPEAGQEIRKILESSKDRSFADAVHDHYCLQVVTASLGPSLRGRRSSDADVTATVPRIGDPDPVSLPHRRERRTG